MENPWLLLSVLVVLLLSSGEESGKSYLHMLQARANAYSVGDYVPMARKGQFHNMRTHWHDIIGRHCPRFGIKRDVVLPIPRPVGYDSGDTYKISLMVGKERFTTPWLLIMGRKSGTMPLVDVTLTHFAGELRGVKATAEPMPQEYIDKHTDVVIQYHNSSHWPKHILVRYNWVEYAEVDVTAGLLVLFGTSFAMTTLLAVYILQSSKDKIAKFMGEQMVESTTVAGEVAKVD